ncbi:helix-turn-helix transcriptional regulator [Streptomyces bobili]|uniref:helix-turn-helix domain-containing protein n=1 Tax=Streptomyces bobili TaxID=67280 RepID=UPI00343652FE
MSIPADRGEYLRTLRSRLGPEDIGASSGPSRRRVPGLRREEVAIAAGISLGHYTRIEQGRVSTVSPDVLDAIARVLLLNDAETRALHDPDAHRRSGHRHDGHRATSTGTGTGTSTSTSTSQGVAPVLTMTLEALPADVPALILDRRTTVLGWNRCAAALLGDFGQVRTGERNLARLVYLGADGWRGVSDGRRVYGRLCVDHLARAVRSEPADFALNDLIGELSVKSVEFSQHWAEQSEDRGTSPVVAVRHPAVGTLRMAVDAMSMPYGPHQSLLIHRPLDGASVEALRRLLRVRDDSGRDDATGGSRTRRAHGGEGPVAATDGPRRVRVES